MLHLTLALATQALAAPAPLAAAAPDAPRPVITKLRALSRSAFELDWRTDSLAPTAPQVLGYRIYRDGKPVAELGASARSWRDSGLSPATVYSYAVAARLAPSANSGEAEVVSPPLSDVTRLPNEGGNDLRASYDVVVAGATPGGIAAAIAAAKLGRKVALLSPSPWLGGMMTGGLSRTDFGSMKSSGGLFHEFVERVRAHYTSTYGPDSAQLKASRTGYYFEPRVAKLIFHQMLAEQKNITVLLDHHTRGVEKNGSRITSVYVLDRPRFVRKVISGKVFIDATYEGDLAAQAGAKYRIGRESREEYGEEHAGEMLWEPTKRQIVMASGRGDRKVQAYNYRLCLTRDPARRKPFPKPAASTYSRERYVTLLPDIASGRLKNMEQVLSILPLPDDKWDANNHPLGNPSSDLIGGADLYPESDLWERERIAEAHRQHIYGLLHFVQDDPEVPTSFQAEARTWGLAADEFVDNAAFPTQLYVREGRRIIGPSTFTENDARSGDPKIRPNSHPDSVGVADYPIDSHATSWEKDGLLEGFFYLAGTQTQPSQVPFSVMTPTGVDGLIVSVCVSCTHIGYGTLRMEPVFLSLGTAAGVAASLAIDENVTPAALPVDDLQRALLAQKQVVCVFNDVPLEHPRWEAMEYFGTKGFFPEYEARPDAPATQAESARWLWSWIQMKRPDLKLSGDAVESLRALKIIGPEPLEEEAPLPLPLANEWIENALRMLNGAPASPRVLPLQLEGAPPITRSELCQRLYESRVSST